MSQVQVHLGGEGRNELGSRSGHPGYQSGADPGVIEILLRRVQTDGWEVTGATQWCRIVKFRAEGPTPNEERNVLGLVLEAKRANAQILAFVWDSDGDALRPKTVAAAIEKAETDFPEVAIIGATAIPALEAWVLAMLGDQGTEALGKAAAQARLYGKGVANTQAMVRVSTDFVLERLPADAASLKAWLGVAGDVLPRRVREAHASDSPRELDPRP